MKYVKQTLICIIPLLCAVGLQVAVSAVAMIGYMVINMAILIRNGNVDAVTTDALISMMMQPNLLLGISALSSLTYLIVFANWFRGMKKTSIHRKASEVFTGKKILLIIALGLSMQLGTTAVLTTVSGWQPNWFIQYNELMKSINGGNQILSFVLVVVIAPFAEEFIFRGVTLEMARGRMPLVWANVLQAALFGLFHMNLIQGIYAFVLGLFLGMVCIRFQSIFASILLHAVFNFSSGLTGAIFPENGSLNLLLAGGTLLAALAVTYVASTFILKEEMLVAYSEDSFTENVNFVEMDE